MAPISMHSRQGLCGMNNMNFQNKIKKKNYLGRTFNNSIKLSIHFKGIDGIGYW